MSQSKKKKLYVYEVGVPVEETWVIEVVAASEQEAKEKAASGQGVQLHSLSGSNDYAKRVREASSKDVSESGGD